MPVNSFLYPNLVKLNGIELTDEGRQPLQESLDKREIVVTLASGKIKKFIQGEFHKWTISYENIPMDETTTVDGCGARNEIRDNIAYQSVPVQLIIQDGKNAPQTFLVYVSSYQDQITRRRLDTFWYNLTLELQEVG